jgi:DNA-binding MarR family transcriptional regulator
VRREQSTRDARAYNAVLTDTGLKRYEEATPTHNVSLRRYLFDNLKGIDLDAFGEALQRIIAAAEGHRGEREPGRISAAGRRGL